MRNLLGVCLLAVTLTIASAPASAWNDYVVAACSGDAGSPEVSRAACHAYIEGFLDGALVTDAAIVDSVTAKQPATSGFYQRAYQTRVSSQRLNLPPTSLAHFCLPENESRAEVVEAIAAGLLGRSDDDTPISDVLYGILKQKYPCPDS